MKLESVKNSVNSVVNLGVLCGEKITTEIHREDNEATGAYILQIVLFKI
jgi:hypothetical protein